MSDPWAAGFGAWGLDVGGRAGSVTWRGGGQIRGSVNGGCDWFASGSSVLYVENGVCQGVFLGHFQCIGAYVDF